jgi:hypothetical protein
MCRNPHESRGSTQFVKYAEVIDVSFRMVLIFEQPGYCNGRRFSEDRCSLDCPLRYLEAVPIYLQLMNFTLLPVSIFGTTLLIALLDFSISAGPIGEVLLTLLRTPWGKRDSKGLIRFTADAVFLSTSAADFGVGTSS